MTLIFCTKGKMAQVANVFPLMNDTIQKIRNSKVLLYLFILISPLLIYFLSLFAIAEESRHYSVSNSVGWLHALYLFLLGWLPLDKLKPSIYFTFEFASC